MLCFTDMKCLEQTQQILSYNRGEETGNDYYFFVGDKKCSRAKKIVIGT